MRLRRNLLFLLPFISLPIVISCKKESHQPPPPQAPKIKTVTAGKDIRNYFYDDKGRVTKIMLVLYGRNEYAYTDTGVVISYYDTTGKSTGKIVYKLNGRGEMISNTSSFSPSSQNSYQYTSAGQLLSATSILPLSGGGSNRWDYHYYYTGSNLDSIISTFNNAGGSNTYYDEYYTDKINTIGNDNYGQSFLGMSSKNPVKLARDIGSSGPGNYPQTSYTYEYDSLDRIVVQRHFWGTSAFTPISFTYY